MGGPPNGQKEIDPVVERLRDRREELGLTQVELARLSGTQQSAISDLETGHSSPTITTLRKIARALKVEIEARDLIAASVERDIMFLKSLDAEALERELISRKWYVYPNDLIGGYCIMPIDAPLSSGCSQIADFINELAAEHIATLHNSTIDPLVFQWIDPENNRDSRCVEQWPGCFSGGYDPRCCRFPKSCSC
jgi:transcriptional regulator with XRE-family HTH domain